MHRVTKDGATLTPQAEKPRCDTVIVPHVGYFTAAVNSAGGGRGGSVTEVN